jgi:hypothetical protein
VSVKGIEATPDKIRAIVHIKPPQSRKKIQKLTGMIAALNRFMSKLTERSLPFFTVLRGSGSFQWGPEQHLNNFLCSFFAAEQSSSCIAIISVVFLILDKLSIPKVVCLFFLSAVLNLSVHL